jgi:hypothetical protein
MTKEEILKDIRAIDDKDNPLLRCDNDGKAMLYAVEKTAERTKRVVIEKAVEWMRNNLHEFSANVSYKSLFDEFKKAMQDESK